MNDSLTVLEMILVVLAVGSAAFWAWALSQKASNRPLLLFLPRRSVPWRGLEVALVIGLLMLGPAIQLAGYLFGSEAGDAKAKSQSITMHVLVVSSLLMLVFVAVIVLVLRVVRRASWEDMGLGGGLVAGGIGIGAVGFLAALLPVYTIKYALTLIYPIEEAQHQILRLLRDHPDALTVAATVFSAAIVAPIVEEFLFRAFLQGWLEAKFFQGDTTEDAKSVRLIERMMELEESVEELTDEELLEIAPDEVQRKQGTVLSGDFDDNHYSSPVDAPDTEPDIEEVESTSYHVPNPVLAIPPILISSALFAAAHLDNWPAPIPLFALAVILGTIYHRTHRLLPCVVLHMLFNGLSLALVWFDA